MEKADFSDYHGRILTPECSEKDNEIDNEDDSLEWVREQKDYMGDYEQMTKDVDFQIEFSPELGKHVFSKKKIENDETILIESPIVAWPIRSSVPFYDIVICENCLKMRPYKSSTSSLLLSSPSTPAPVKLSDNGSKIIQDRCLMHDEFGASDHTGIRKKEDIKISAHDNIGADDNKGYENQSFYAIVGKYEMWFCSLRCCILALGVEVTSYLGQCNQKKRKHSASIATLTTSFEEAASFDLSSAKLQQKWVGGWLSIVGVDTIWKARLCHDRHLELTPSESFLSSSVASVPSKICHLPNEFADASFCSSSILLMHNENPLPYEAIVRVIGTIAAYTLHISTQYGLTIDEAYKIACRPFQRLIHIDTANILPYSGDNEKKSAKYVASKVDSSKNIFYNNKVQMNEASCPWKDNHHANDSEMYDYMKGSRRYSDFDIDRIMITLTSQLQLRKRLKEHLNEEVIDNILDKNTILLIFQKLMLNSQSLNLWGADKYGNVCVLKCAGVYTLHSCFNHSCVPNCEIHTDVDSTLYIKTKTTVLPREQLTISYIDYHLPPQQRQKLLSNYFFQCTCRLCEENFHSIEI